MGELTSQERLQPSLLDRLTDEVPAQADEHRDERVISAQRLRECVVRDLSWLLNCTHAQALQSFDTAPRVATSVLNFGIPDLTGVARSGVDVAQLERRLRAAILAFEPRLIAETLRVHVRIDQTRMDNRSLVFDIESEMWAQPIPLNLYLKTEVDLETGRMSVSESLELSAVDPRLLPYYNRELGFVREMGAEFAREYPKIAGRLGLDGFECADPYVERLLEGFAFMAARVQLKLDAQYPVFTQHLMEMLYPQYLRPVPSMAVVQLHPDPKAATLAGGHAVPRHTVLRATPGTDARTSCEFRTAHALTLWPVEVAGATYFETPAALAAAGVVAPDGRDARAGLRLTLRTTGDVDLSTLRLDTLPVFLAGADERPKRLYEQLLADAEAVLVRGDGAHAPVQAWLGPDAIRARGFDDADALLPVDGRSFSGYRLLQEYFACPERFLFAEFNGLRPALQRMQGQTCEIVVLLKRSVASLARGLDASHFRLFCTPAINLFPRSGDRIHLRPEVTEYHVVADRIRPMDFEVFGVTRVEGFGDRQEPEVGFQPFYGGDTRTWHAREGAYYTLRREPRLLSGRQRREGARSSYVGSELFLSLVDAGDQPLETPLRQVGLQLLCSNRDLPLHMPVGKGSTDFTLDAGLPIAQARCVAGPTRPRPALASGETAWRLLSHLQFDYLSLFEGDPASGAAGLRELLSLYCDPHDAATLRQVEGIKAIASAPIVRRLPVPGPITFGRGLEITLTCDDGAFEGTGAYLIGAVLQRFFARYASVNGFTETVLRTLERREVTRWPARIGTRQLA